MDRALRAFPTTPSRRGLSLLEVLLALGLTAVVLLIMMGVFLRGTQLSKQGEALTHATETGMLVLEHVKSMDYTLIPATSSFSSVDGDPANSDGFPPEPYQPDANPALLVQTSVVSPTMKAIVVTVDTEGGKPLVLETYVRE